MTTVGKLMTTDFVTVDARTSVIEAAMLMKTCSVESILVARQARLVGIVTESDIVRKFVGVDRVSYFVSVEEIMNSPILRIEECRPLAEAADLMEKCRTWHLGVTRGGVLIGVVSVRDFLRPVSAETF